MRNRELGVLIIGLLCIALPAVTEWLLPLHGLEPDLGTSSMYTEQERMDAAKAVARYCDDELLRLTYLGDGQAARETSRANDFGYEESIAFRGDFRRAGTRRATPCPTPPIRTAPGTSAAWTAAAGACSAAAGYDFPDMKKRHSGLLCRFLLSGITPSGRRSRNTAFRQSTFCYL